MQKVTALLLVYAILVIASSIFWVWSAMAKPAAGTIEDSINFANEPDKEKPDAEMAMNNATELTGGVTDDVKADGQVRRHREVK